MHDLRFGQIYFQDGRSEWVFTFYAVPNEDGKVSFSQKMLPSESFTASELADAFKTLWKGILGEKVNI